MVQFLARAKILSFKSSSSALEATRPHIQCAPDALFPEAKRKGLEAADSSIQYRN